jgi:predicted Zn-dependent protease
MRLNEVQPDDEELRLILEAGYVLREAGHLDDAEKVFRGVIALMPGADVPRVALGTVHLQRGLFKEAEAACEEALRLCPESLYARVHYAESLLFQQKRADAEAELRAVIATDPDSAHSRTARALLKDASLICSQADEGAPEAV